MFVNVRKSFKRALAGAMAILLAFQIPVSTDLKVNHVIAATQGISETFEFETLDSGALQGKLMGSPILSLSTDAHSGEHSLQVSGREQEWYSYEYDLSKYQGMTISVSAFVKKATDGATALCMKHTVDNETKYEWIATAMLTADEWGQISNKNLEVPDAAIGFYFVTCDTEYQGNKEDYLIDDVSITVVSGAQPGTQEAPSIHEDFNDGDSYLGGKFGGPELKIVDSEIMGSKALAVTNRTSGYFGYSYNLASYAGNTISLSAKVSAFEANEGDENTISATISVAGVEPQYQCVANVAVSGSAIGVIKTDAFEVPAGGESYTLYFETTQDVSYVIDDIAIDVVGEYVNPNASDGDKYADISGYEILKDLYKDYFKVGVACEEVGHWGIQTNEIGNPYKEALMLQQFNSITFGNELKAAYNMGWNSEEATDTNLPFVIDPSAKSMLDWAKENHMPVRGHVLVWHSQTAEEAFCIDYKTVYLDDEKKVLDPNCFVTRDVMLKRMESYIYNTMEYMYQNGYGDVLYAWDVVNEAIFEGANEYDLRDSYWYKIIGPDFIYQAFKYAREAVNKYSVEYASLYGVDENDEEALKTIQPKLFYNDYNEWIPRKRDAIIANVTREYNGHSIVGDGLIDGIGMQGHLSDNADIKEFIEALRAYDAVVDEVHITELDIGQTLTGVNAEYNQAVFYNKFFKALMNEVENGVNLTCVTIWGLTDDNSWRKESNPLLFNKDLSKKLAFDAMVCAITGEPMPEPTYVPADLSDKTMAFESGAEEVTLEDLGFKSRGDSVLTIQNDVVFAGKAALLASNRNASWHGAAFDVTNYIGQTIDISAWVKTTDNIVKLSADINNVWPNIASVDTSDGEWVHIMGRYKIPKELTSLSLYFETDGTADIYIDNVKTRLVGLEESFEGAEHIAAPRGVGHVPHVAVVANESHNATGHSYMVTREEAEASMKFDVTPYINQLIQVTAYVKTTDKKVKLGFEGSTPIEIACVDAVQGDWTKITGVYQLPNDITSAKMYIETDGTADFYVDDIFVKIAEFIDDVEGDGFNFTTRWGGAGTIEKVEDGENNHAAKLTNRDECYYGIAFDVSRYLGMQIMVTLDVKTEDQTIKLAGDIADQWPNYATVPSTPGEYKTIAAICTLPKDLQKLNLYIETDGTTDLYVDNLHIDRVPLCKECLVKFNMNGHGTDSTLVVSNGSILPVPMIEEVEGFTFEGWYKDEAFTQAWDFATDKVTANTVLFAKWSQNTPSITPTPKPEPTPEPADTVDGIKNVEERTEIKASALVQEVEVTKKTLTIGLTLTAEQIEWIEKNGMQTQVVRLDFDTTELEEILNDNSKIKSFEVNLNTEGIDNLGNLTFVIPMDVVNVLKQAGVKTVVTNNGTDSYSLKLNAGQLKKIRGDIKVTVDIEDDEENNKTVSFNSIVRNDVLATMTLDVSSVVEGKNKQVYVYRKNKETGCLEEIPNYKKKVSKEGTINIVANLREEYVVSSEKIEENVVGLLDTATVKAPKTMKKGSTKKLSTVLSDELSVVSQFDSSKDPYGKEEAKVTYRVSDESIATIDANGTLTAKKAGKVDVTITILLENKDKKVITKTVTVK